MLLSKVKSIFEQKILTLGGLKPPDSNDKVSDLCHEALCFVAGKCTPNELLRDECNVDGEKVWRMLPNGKYLIEPEYPDFTQVKRHLQIDETLNFAVINKMCALYSRDAKDIAKFEAESLRLINTFKANFIKL